jgi:hypothetical protein
MAPLTCPSASVDVSLNVSLGPNQPHPAPVPGCVPNLSLSRSGRVPEPVPGQSPRNRQRQGQTGPAYKAGLSLAADPAPGGCAWRRAVTMLPPVSRDHPRLAIPARHLAGIVSGR